MQILNRIIFRILHIEYFLTVNTSKGYLYLQIL